RQAVILLADEKYLVRHAGAWQEGGVSETLRMALRELRTQPLRPFQFGEIHENVGPAIYSRCPRAESESVTESAFNWRPGDQLFIPVTREDGSVFGFLSLEAPLDGTRPREDVVRLLDILLTHGALHLQAQELRDELRRRAAELETRVQERTRELRQSEERFSRLVNSTTDIVYVTDVEDKLIFLNEAFTKTLGYVRENYLGRTLRKVLEELTTENPINHRALQELAQLAGEHSLHRVEVVTREGDKRTLEINRTIVRRGGVLAGTQGIIRDITEHRVLLQQLVTSERLAAMGRLATGIAHEINNPLQAMSSQLRVVATKSATGQSTKEHVELLHEGIERIRAIVRGLLDLHRGSSTERVPVDLNEATRKVLALLRQQTHEHSIRVIEELRKELPSVHGSLQEIQQVILNLVLNAIEAMPQGGDLVVSSQAKEEVVQLAVRDSGVGIPSEHLLQIFEPFFSFKLTEGGTGLGLYLSKNIMESHNGRITVESEKGKGTCFTLSFPRS
ncbi:PAS domain S-box protein, partial [bacterium]|nr:PAS domain S-box protein [bacterium]